MSISLLPGATSLTLGPRHMDPVHGDIELAAGPVVVGDQVLSGGKSGNVILLDRSNATLAVS
jgi:hypothetical protein